MPHFICTACGTQHAETAAPPAQCVICEEERQYVPPRGQTWTTLDALQASHMNAFHEHEPNVIGIGATPAFAIGQRAVLVRTPGGNVLWDCIAPLDAATIALVKGLGGIKAIAISHPHFYTTMVEWAQPSTRRSTCTAPTAIGSCARTPRSGTGTARPINCGTASRWSAAAVISPAARCCIGPVGAEGKGIVCSGDILTVTVDRKWLTFMRSYPNMIPLSRREVEGIGRAMAPFSFARIYGHYFDRVIMADGKAVLEKSVARYIAAIEGTRGY